MRKPRDMKVTPKDGWFFTEPSTGQKFWATHPKALQRQVFKYRLDHPELNLDTGGNWEKRMWHHFCEQHPHLPYDDTDEARWFPNIADVFNFVQTLVKWKLGGGKMVDQAEAEARANICLSGVNGHPCPHNEPASFCAGCKGFGDQITGLVEGRKTSKNDRLHICTACGGCDLKVKVFFPLDCISVNEDRLPNWCWQRKSSPTSQAPA